MLINCTKILCYFIGFLNVIAICAKAADFTIYCSDCTFVCLYLLIQCREVVRYIIVFLDVIAIDAKAADFIIYIGNFSVGCDNIICVCLHLLIQDRNICIYFTTCTYVVRRSNCTQLICHNLAGFDGCQILNFGLACSGNVAQV